MSRVTEALTAKVGPLPAWAWGLGLGVTVVGVRAYLARRDSTPAAAVTSDGAAAAAGANLSGDITEQTAVPGSVGAYPLPSNYQANPGGVIGPDGTDGGSGDDSRPVNNLDWSNQAFDVLRARGYSAVAATEAVRKYLAGEALTTSEEGMIGITLTAIGQPPEGAPPISRAGSQSTGAPATQPVPGYNANIWSGSAGGYAAYLASLTPEQRAQLEAEHRASLVASGNTGVNGTGTPTAGNPNAR